MKYCPDKYHRRSIRLRDYDYSQNGAYFLTICVQNRECLFGEIINDKVELNDAGKMIDVQWNELSKRFDYIQLDEYIVMPNHFHGIVVVGAPLVGAQNTHVQKMAGTRPAPTNIIIGDVVGAFKSIATREYVNNVKNNHWRPFDKKIWQRNYYEHIIRNEKSFHKIREYIVNNPINWRHDELNPLCVS